MSLSATEYRLLVQHSPVMIWRAGLDAKCDYFNETWLAYTGRTAEQESGDGWAEGVHPEDLQRCVDYYLEHFRRREAFEMEYRLRRHDGVYRWILDRGVPYVSDSGEFAGFIGSCVDVDDRRRAQIARDHRNSEKLAKAHEFEQWVLAIVSHDLRNPLSAIVTAVDLLTMESEDPKVRRLTHRISRSADRITHIVADLLDLSREREGGGIPITPARADLHAITREVADELRSFSGREIVVECEGEATGVWDANRIAQALSNLVGNAIKHGEPGPIRVRVEATADSGSVAVHNAGSIRADLVPTLFAPFGPRSDRKRDGLGLGLFIARAIARAHRGDVDVSTNAEHGTTFRLSVPRQPD